ncbi:MAG: LPS export ABC transporter periplasmic protein LptC [Ignavibacteriae bacterium]|nr:LPS export ABC transporter periplasmic protein LptC [Ignavibacteriota bacterium]
MKEKRINILVGILLILIPIILICQETGQKGPPIQLKNANEMVGDTINGGSVRIFNGNVVLTQGNVTVKSDKAIHYLDLNIADLTGNVVITQNDMTLKAPHINYNGNSRIAVANNGVELIDKEITLKADFGKYSTETLIADFEKNVTMLDGKSTLKAKYGKYSRKTEIADFEQDVIVDDDSATITARKVTFDKNNRNSFAYGDVIVRGKFSNVILTGDTVINLAKERYTKSYGKPVLYQIDTVKTVYISSTYNQSQPFLKDSGEIVKYEYDTLSIASDTMEAFRDIINDKYVFTNNVEMNKGNSAAIANYSIYFKKEDIINLTGKPIVWYDSTQLHADSISVSIADKKLKSIKAFGNALAASRDDSLFIERINQIIGDDININIETDTIRKITSYGNAKSLYFSSGNESDEGAARNSSDSIIIDFDLGKVYSILWLGGIQGEYFPLIMFEADPQKIFLPGFRWSDNKPQKRKIPKL